MLKLELMGRCAAIAISLGLQACALGAGVLLAGRTPGHDLYEFEQRVNANPKNTAIAVASGFGQMVWGGVWAKPTPESARDEALRECAGAVARAGMSLTCRIHMINGVEQ